MNTSGKNSRAWSQAKVVCNGSARMAYRANGAYLFQCRPCFWGVGRTGTHLVLQNLEALFDDSEDGCLSVALEPQVSSCKT